MTKRRSRGVGGLHWSEDRQTLDRRSNHRAPSERQSHRAQGRQPDEDRSETKLKEILRDHEDGLTVAPHDYTVAQALTDWLANYERTGHDTNAIRTVRGLVENHVIPALGARRCSMQNRLNSLSRNVAPSAQPQTREEYHCTQ